MYTEAVTEFNLDKHLLSFLQDSPFFAELSRYIRKIPTKDIPTAGVTYHLAYDDITLYWNPEFFASLEDNEIRGVLIHEYYHLIFSHLTKRLKKPFTLWNIATDLAINSIISTNVDIKNCKLPAMALIPGMIPHHPLVNKNSENKTNSISSLIASFPHDQSAEWYFNSLKENIEKLAKQAKNNCPIHGDKKSSDSQNSEQKDKQKDKQEDKQKDKQEDKQENHNHNSSDSENNSCNCAEDWIDSLDDHSGWNKSSEDMNDIIASKISNIVNKAVKVADSQANGWGHIPAHHRDMIRQANTTIVNWRNVLRQFIGKLSRGNKVSSIKRINKRYPYIHPGTKRGYATKLLVAIDQSGSVNNQMLSLFFGELSQLTKLISISVVPFDCETIHLKDIIEWKKGANISFNRSKAGGTNFNFPTLFANNPKHRGKWDGLLILTDGIAPKPIPSRIKRAWCLAPNCGLPFSSDELTISMDTKTITK